MACRIEASIRLRSIQLMRLKCISSATLPVGQMLNAWNRAGFHDWSAPTRPVHYI